MPKGYDIMVHLYNIMETPTKAIHITIKGTNLITKQDFNLEATEIFNPEEVADTVTRLLKSKNIASAEYTDVILWQ